MGGCASSQGSLKQPSPINKPACHANSHLGQSIRSGGRERWLIAQNRILMDAWKISYICLFKFYRPLDFQLEPGPLSSPISSSLFQIQERALFKRLSVRATFLLLFYIKGV